MYQTRSAKNTTIQYIEDSYESGPTSQVEYQKLYHLKLSPMFRSSLSDVVNGLLMGKSVNHLYLVKEIQRLKSCDFVHSVQWCFGSDLHQYRIKSRITRQFIS